MCGIYGLVLQAEPNREQVRAVRTFFTSMAHAAASRGRDAAGFAAVEQEGRAWVHRTNRSSEDQIRDGSWETRLRNVGRNVRALIGHTRLATHGANIPQNAHPFSFYQQDLGTLVGTHNGVIYNYKDMYPFSGRPFDCDSANLFCALAQKSDLEWPEIFGRVQGWYALAMQRRNRLFFARNTSSPCVFATVPALGMLAWASTEGIIRHAAYEHNVEVGEVTELDANKLVCMDLYGRLKYMIKLPEEKAATWDDYEYFANLVLS